MLFQKNDIIFQEGSYGTKFFFIIEGEVDILKQK